MIIKMKNAVFAWTTIRFKYGWYCRVVISFTIRVFQDGWLRIRVAPYVGFVYVKILRSKIEWFSTNSCISALLSYQCRLPSPPPPPPPQLLPSLDTERITSVPGIITSATPRLIFIPSRITTPTVKNAPNYMTVTQWFFAITSWK